MRSRFSVFALVFGLLSLVVVAPVHAGAIFLSGDSNIINPLTGNITPIDVGNQQFFQNVLSGGTTVVVHGGAGFGTSQAGFTNTFYNSLGGITSSLLGGLITGGALAGVDLLVSILPSVAYTAPEIAAMAAFQAGSGNLFFIGEHGNFNPVSNGRINAGLLALGTGLSIIPNTVFDGGFQQMPGNGGTIVVDTFTAGVNTFTYAAPSGTSSVAGGTNIFLGTQRQAFITYEAMAVPEPSTLLLLGAGLMGLGVFRRRFTG